MYRSNGDLYFTDPPFGLPKGFEDPAKELPYQGVYRLTPEGEVTLLVSDRLAPNGIAFSPDERTLYVSDVDPARSAWLAYTVNTDGTLSNGRVFFDGAPWRTDTPSGPDGMKVDKAGNLFGSRPGGVSVFAPDGTHLGDIETGVATSNVAWGDDGSTLYVTADKALFRIKLQTVGSAF